MKKRAIYTTAIYTPLGVMFGQCTDDALTRLWFKGQKNMPSAQFYRVRHPILDMARNWLAAYFAKEQPDPGALPLLPAGTPYQKQVWQILLQIGWGQTKSYEELTCALREAGFSAGSARACGNAVGKNPIAIIIPCHRVIRKNGELGGYAGAPSRKYALLLHERILS